MKYVIVFGYFNTQTKHTFTNLKKAKDKLSELNAKFPYINKKIEVF